MKFLACVLIGLFSFALASAEENLFLLKSADGRAAKFSGILAVNEAGLLVSRGADPAPILLRWELLDLPDLERRLPEISKLRGAGETNVALGIYARESQPNHPQAAIYRILHSPRQVSPPKFNDFFSRVPPSFEEMGPPNPHDFIHFFQQYEAAEWRYKRLLERLFPDENITLERNFSWSMEMGSTDLQAPQLNFDEEHDESVWYLTPFRALETLVTREMTVGRSRSGPHVELEFTRWAANYLRREDILQSLVLEMIPLIDAADVSEKAELRRIVDALDTLRPHGAVDPQAINKLRPFLDRYRLPKE